MTEATIVEAKPLDALARPDPQPIVAMTPMQMISRVVQEGADPNALDRVTAWAERMQANEARTAFAQAMTNFKAICPTVAQLSKGHTNKYAKLVDIDEQIRPALAQCQLSSTWRVSKDDREWIEVECRVTHVMGHSESTSFGGPPDRGAGRNELQARASTVSYLERYTLKALLGIVDKDMPDDDGAGGAEATKPQPKSANLTDHAENQARKDFWSAAQQKAKTKFTADQIRAIFAVVQQMSGKSAAADCLSYLQREDVLVAQDGTVSHVDDAQGAVCDDVPQTSAAPGTPPTSSTSPEPPSLFGYQCPVCGETFKVLPAGGKCHRADGMKCNGTVKKVG